MKENITAIRHFVLEKEGKWHQKWKEFLGLSPFDLIKGRSSVSTVDLCFGEEFNFGNSLCL